jgi:hypothetical protein
LWPRKNFSRLGRIAKHLLGISTLKGRRRRPRRRRRMPERRRRRRPARRQSSPASWYFLLKYFDTVNICWTYVILCMLNN